MILRDVTLFTSGLYGCEASAQPSFHTELVRKRMTVLGKFLNIFNCIITKSISKGYPET